MSDMHTTLAAFDEMDAEELVIRLERADEAYHDSGTPIMEDWAYDAMKDRLRALDPDNDYLKRVGTKPSSAWKKVNHTTPMGSLGKVQLSTELEEWWAPGVKYVLSEKLDGISVTVEYEEGKLVLGATRGDGSVGEDITRNVVKMRGVKSKLGNFTGKLRGEIVLTKSDKARFFAGYVNERNAAAGIAKRYDGEGCDKLNVMFYRIILDDPAKQAKLDTKTKEFTLMQKLGLPTPFHATVSSFAQAQKIYEDYIASTRESLDYLIDGLVLDVDDKDTAETLGEDSEGRPRGAVAYKFPHAKAQTTLLDVIWQTGKAGRCTPVAILAPVFLAGVTVERASLHNWSHIEKIGLKSKGATIVASRRNDVIPYVEEVVKQGKGPEIKKPENCPSCDFPLHRDGEFFACGNKEDCPAQVRGGMQKWIEAVGLLDWGSAILDALTDEHGVSEPAHLYTVTEDMLSGLMLSGRVLGDSMAKRMVLARDQKKSLSLGAAVGAMCIPMCAKSTCESIVAAGFDDLDKMAAAKVSDLMAIEGIGDAKAEAFVTNFPAAKERLERLLAAGFEIKSASGGTLSGEVVCFTGWRDADVARRVEDAGGIMKDGISKKVTILVADNPTGTSGKLKKARGYGIRIIGRDELLDMLR